MIILEEQFRILMSITTIIDTIETLKGSGDYTKARRVAETALLEYTDDYRLYEEIADISLFEGKVEEAETMIAHAQSLNPESATGVYLSGYTAMAQNQFDRAIEHLTRANTLFPNNPEILRNLWWAYCMLWTYTKWVTILRRAHNLAPEDDMIAEDLAVWLISSWEVTEGAEILEKFGKNERIATMKDFGLLE